MNKELNIIYKHTSTVFLNEACYVYSVIDIYSMPCSIRFNMHIWDLWWNKNEKRLRLLSQCGMAYLDRGDTCYVFRVGW